MRPVGVTKKGKKDRHFHASNWLFAQTTHVDIGPEILRAGSCPGSSYIFQVSWKSVQGSRSCGGSKIALSHWQGHGLYNSLYYRTSRDEDMLSSLVYVPYKNVQINGFLS